MNKAFKVGDKVYIRQVTNIYPGVVTRVTEDGMYFVKPPHLGFALSRFSDEICETLDEAKGRVISEIMREIKSCMVRIERIEELDV